MWLLLIAAVALTGCASVYAMPYHASQLDVMSRPRLNQELWNSCRLADPEPGCACFMRAAKADSDGQIRAMIWRIAVVRGLSRGPDPEGYPALDPAEMDRRLIDCGLMAPSGGA